MGAHDSDPRDLVDRWVTGWMVSRDLQGERLGRAWAVTVASEKRELEYVVAEPDSAEAAELASAASGRSDVWLTVVGSLAPDAAAALAPLDAFEHGESLMTIPLVDTPVLDPTATDPSVRDVRLEADGLVAHARILRGETIMASGQAALSGTDVVADKIVTHPDFRRQGLGRAVMAALSLWAVERGALTGMLVASDQGRALYRSLGWHDAAPVSSFRGARPAA